MTPRARSWARRAVPALAFAMAVAAQPAQAEMEIIESGGGGGPGSSIPCSEINNRAMEATMVLRQHASALSVGFEADARVQAAVMLAWLDQWAGRLRGYVELGEFSACLDDGDTETYRRALVTAQRVANQTREDLLRPARAQQQHPQHQQRPRRP